MQADIYVAESCLKNYTKALSEELDSLLSPAPDMWFYSSKACLTHETLFTLNGLCKIHRSRYYLS